VIFHAPLQKPRLFLEAFSRKSYTFALLCFVLGILNMVVIRLARGGAKKRPFFHIVATDSRSRRDGRFIERLGYYNPVAVESEKGLMIHTERLAHWQNVGAQLSPTVARLVKQATKAAA
jgi:small subunit ribosomal protein S16